MGGSVYVNDTIAIGPRAHYSNFAGGCNIAIGANAMYNSCAQTTDNVAIGYGALYSTGTSQACNNNIAIGTQSLCSIRCGRNNIALGYRSQASNSSGCNNISFGCNSSCGVVSGNNNIQFNNGFISTAGNNNILLNSGISSYGDTASNNIGIGTCYSIGCGTHNIVVGPNAMTCNVTGYGNIAFGQTSLQCNTTGNNNIAMSYGSLKFNLSGCDNIALGYTAGRCNNASNNVILGACAFLGNLTGANNVAIGWAAGCNTTYGFNNVLIGCNAQSPTFTTCNTITLGDVSISCIHAQVSTITAFSDCRDKTNICSIPVGLEFVRALRPVKFEWNMRNNPNDGKKGMTEPGFIAQELDQVVEQFDAEWMQLVSKDNPDRWEATIGRLLPVLTRAVQELAEENESIRSRTRALKELVGSNYGH
jgi:hypothetical protein